MNTPLDVTVVGCIGIDTNIYLYNRDVDFSVESNFSENIDCIGQAGGYSTFGFRLLGRSVGFIGSVGDYHNGDFIRSQLRALNVESVLMHDPTGTHRSINFMYRDGRRKNFYDGKGHMQIDVDLRACEALIERSKVVHVHLENWCRQLLPLAKKHNVAISCDLQDITSLNDPYRDDFINAADVLFFSCVNFPEPKEAISALRRNNPNRVIVGGMGARGCVLSTSQGLSFHPAVELPLPICDTNGAGDALAVGFLSSHLLDGLEPQASILRAQICARHKCAVRASPAAMIDPISLQKWLALFH
jgi:sugar/nucleoside kinase (ribokinase family)